MRILAALVAFALCAAAGARKARLLKDRKVIIDELIAMLCEFSIGIRCTASTFDELCASAKGRFADYLRESRASAPDIRAAWETACEKLKALACCGDEADILLELGSSLGKSDAEGQLALIELYKNRLCACSSAAADDLNKKGKLFSSVGMLCGIGAAIIII